MASVVDKFWQAIYEEKAFKDNVFLPDEPTAVPFEKQIDFFCDRGPTKLARCGNRSGKTATNFRDLAWRVMHKHPYLNEEYCETVEEYMATKPREYWVAAPDLTFINDVIWNRFLKTYIPQWYYTNDELVPMVSTEKTNGTDFIYSVTFRNGDTIKFRTYSQNLTSKMGASIYGLWLDEPPPSLQMLVELVMRVMDQGGVLSLGFTPVDVPDDIIDWVENHEGLSQHRWSIYDNPVFRDDEVKLNRVLAELKSLPEHKRNLRIHGDWDKEKEKEEDRVWSNVYPVTVKDFPIPHNWRQVRVADPAGGVTGFSIFAEDPVPNELGECDWYCIHSEEISLANGKKNATAMDIEARMETRAPFPEYQYFMSIYDNAENWFANHAVNKQGQWMPCLLKNVELFNNITRDVVAAGKLKFFAIGAALAVRQFMRARRNPKTGKISFKKLHAIDTVRYFCPMIPPFDPNHQGDKRTEVERINDEWTKKLQAEWNKIGQEQDRIIPNYQSRQRR